MRESRITLDAFSFPELPGLLNVVTSFGDVVVFLPLTVWNGSPGDEEAFGAVFIQLSKEICICLDYAALSTFSL